MNKKTIKAELEEWRESYFDDYVKEMLDKFSIDCNDEKVIIEQEHYVLRCIYSTSSSLERAWLKSEYPEIKKWHMEKFPTMWMTKNQKIVDVIERCHAFIPIVNYLFHHNQSWRGSNKKERIKMQEYADKITGGKRYTESGHEYVYSTFITRKDFYRGICRATRYSKSNIQRYLKALTKIGCIKELDKGKGGKGVLYADGYYVPAPDNKYRKITFLKDSPEIKSGLIKLPNWINEYQTKSIRRVKRHV
jgi:hypothetical protein